MGTHQINGVTTPTSSTDAANKQYVDSLSSAGGATNYIQNTNALQAGSTFYVSSGTVATNLTVGNNVAIGGVASGNGSGLTNLTAASINAGTLGSSVIASSIAVNAVYPAAVNLAAYGNIQGIGTQTQALNMGTHQINGLSNPTSGTDAANKQYVDGLSGVGGSTNYIQNSNILQAGSTFYVSSGTVATNLTVGNNLAVGGIATGNGSGLTNLTAANINAGTLGASVVASSIAVNAVYPAAVSLTTYSNIQGIGTQAQALNMGTHQINGLSNPTSGTDAANKQYVDGLSGAGGSTNYIQNTGTLQAGSTFYVSSGTVATNLTVGNNLAIGGMATGNGSGLTNLTAANINAGTLGASVVASSIAVNAVVPTAVSAAAYGNIQGIGTQAQALNMGTHQINGLSNPSSGTDAANKQYVDGLSGAGGSTNYIQNSNTLQAGSTFYVSSGTVATNLTVGNNLAIGGIATGNGSGLNNLMAANINPGTLGSGVITSSIAVNAVVPTAMSAAAYSNIQGIGTQTQALNMNSHLINNVSLPVSATDAASKQYVDTFASGSTNYIRNSGTLQSGATFYVSSGTVATTLTVGTNLIVDGTLIGNGSTLTNLTPGNISAGSLPSTVINSSDAVNTVYPAAVSLAIYGNIQGLGAQTQALNMNTHQINALSNPTSGADAANKQYVDSAIGVGGTTNYIQNTGTLQAGSTFYVSSGTIAGNLTVGGVVSGNGSGLTNLAATNINAGTLGSSVVSSSIAVNAVYPAAVSAAAYSNIQGVGAQSQALNMNTHQINGVSMPSSPTDAATKQYVDTFASGSTNYVQISSALQSGATFYVSSGTVSGQMSVGSMTITGNQLSINGVPYKFPNSQGGIQTIPQNDGAGNITWITTPSGGSGSGNLQVFNGTTLISSPTVEINFATTTFNAAFVGGSTAIITLNGSSVTLQGNTFNGPSQLVQLNGSTQLPGLSGTNLTNLTPGNISAGSLPVTVIASSIAVNAVYPAAVSAAVYANIQGVGAQTQVLNMNTHQINALSNPTLGTDAANKQYVDSAVSSGGTTNYIQNTGTLQAGSTFYVSSGTVASNLTVGNNLVVSGILSGSGSGLTNLTAANINAGTLGASVVASSIAVNSVYPAGVSVGAYANIQGVGAQTQALNMNTHQINALSNPTSGTDAANKQYVDSAVGTGGTTNYIQNTGTLQAGSTFYVSSGTVANNFTVGNNVAIGGIASGNGSGLTNLAAANISAGSLGASVVASSIAVNSVVPSVVSAAAYSNIQGVGAQTQALNMNTHQINAVSNPTSGTDAANKQYVDSAVGSGGTTNYIQNTGTLQAGSTFYVSSGTVANNLTIGNNVAIGGTATGNGSGLTNLTAANINAGSLGAGVIASSIAVNAVVPTAVSAAAYGNIQGIGAQTQALNMGTHQINGVSNPTSGTDAANKQYVDGLSGAGGSTNYIQNTGTLQAGSTFYVSSGTVANNLTVGNNVAIGGTASGNGSGLTNLTAANINAGTLGASVIASSIAVNAVYPAAVSLTTYGNIQGLARKHKR